uniref:Uncharacterized protein n=1 Tax=Periophthalmus magnuspinnatus TaxID=409849 RepID=A0A3B3ZH09_9GOBI
MHQTGHSTIYSVPSVHQLDEGSARGHRGDIKEGAIWGKGQRSRDGAQRRRVALRPLRSLPRLRTLRDVLPDDSSVCVSETEERLLCTERSRFNLNTFGLRFGKRHGSPRTIPKTRPRTNPKTNPVQLKGS